MDKSKWGTHIGHCCIIHGCKYGDEDCPVVNGETVQQYTCEYCVDDDINSVEDIQLLLKWIDKLHRVPKEKALTYAGAYIDWAKTERHLLE